MYSRILVGIDGSAGSEHALTHAIGLAKLCSAALRVIHVVDTGWLALGPEIAIDVEPLAAARRTAGEQLLARTRDTVRSAGLEADAALLETGTSAQDIAGAIAEDAVRWPVDVVLLGTHGHRGLGRLMLGSVAERVARLSSVPALLVPPAARRAHQP